MAENDVIDQEYTYPDDQYEGELGVDDKVPDLKWAVPSHKAVAELFNWVARKSYEDITRLVNWISNFGATQSQQPFEGLFPINGKEPSTVLVNDYITAFDLVDNRATELRGEAKVLRTSPSLMLQWSVPDVTIAEPAELSIDVDVFGKSETGGNSVISTTASLDVPNNNNIEQETEVALSLSTEDTSSDGWADVLGKHMVFYISRDPTASGDIHLHSVEVR